VHLSPEEREVALLLPRALQAGRGAPDPVAASKAALNGLQTEYIEIVELGGARLLSAAARVGSTRLIDNVLLEGELP
jgi:pantothenate synthetase